MGRLVTVANQKGGVGKTTVTANLGAALALAGKRVVVVDLDPQGNLASDLGYGDDDVTRAVERRIGELFEREAAVFLVPTGTAANALALAHISPPWGAVFAHAEAHILTDECGAPEFFGAGLKLVAMPGVGCKVAPETFSATVAQYQGHVPHQVVPAAFSFAQASEAGTIYRPGEIRIESRTRTMEIALEWRTWIPTKGVRYRWTEAEPGLAPDTQKDVCG